MTHIMAFKVVPAGLTSSFDCLLLHVVDRVADERAYRLAVLALFLRDRLVVLLVPALRLFMRRLPQLFQVVFALPLMRLWVLVSIGSFRLALRGGLVFV